MERRNSPQQAMGITDSESHRGQNASNRPIHPLAQEYSVLWNAKDPSRQVGYCPALLRAPSGRLVGNMLVCDKRPAVEHQWLVKVHTSDDRGNSWTHRADFPMVDSFPFVAGRYLYVIGGRDDLKISRSGDNGETWSPLVKITEGKQWYSHPGSAAYANGRIYFVMDCRTEQTDHGFPVWILAPVVLSARLDDDLTKPESWTFSNDLSFRDVRNQYGDPQLIGVPLYPYGKLASGRSMSEIGWGETNLVQIKDPNHLWYDPAGHTFHLFMRANTGLSNLACLAKAVESADGKQITVSLQDAASGKPLVYIPFPTSYVSFHIACEEVTRLYWMISSQATDSLRKIELMQPKRYGLPNNERDRLVLYFSHNCIDWCFAGLVAASDDVGQSHHGGNMIIDDDDLHILMRTADKDAENAHNSNLITFHTIKKFRELVY